MKKNPIKIGEVLGRLTVLTELLIRTKHGSKRFLCQCSCGKEKVIVAGQLRKETRSCGCLQKEAVAQTGLKNRGPVGEVTLNSLESKYKGRAKRLGYVWQLSQEQFRKLIKKNCFHCGAAPQLKNKYGANNIPMPSYSKINLIWAALQGIQANGIDRLDNSKGYTEENSVPCCNQCNIMKMDYSELEFINHMKQILSFKGVLNAEK